VVSIKDVSRIEGIVTICMTGKIRRLHLCLQLCIHIVMILQSVTAL
jgi:non-canonical (house-cleaning) NTP pyrophosphatase